MPSVFKNEYLEQAIELGQKALKLNPSSFQAHFALGRAYLNKGDFDQSLKYLEKALALNPPPDEMEKLYFYLGLGLFNKGSIYHALDCFKKYAEYNPALPEPYFYMATCYREKEEYDNAVALYKKVITLDPAYEYVYSALGSVYILQNNYQDAIDAFQKNIQINGKNQRDLYSLGTCHLACKNYDEAIKCWKEISTITPLSEWVLIGLGIAYYSKNSFEQAVDTYKQLLEKQSVDTLSHHRRAADRILLNLSREVITSHGKKNFTLRSDNMMHYYLLSIIYRMQGSYDKAIEICDKLLEIDPKDNLASFLLGEFYSEEKVYLPSSIDAYKKAFDADNRDTESAEKLIKGYLENKEYDLALVYTQKALTANPDEAVINFLAGLAYLKKGLPYSAQPLLEKAMELDNTNPEVFLYLGDVYMSLKNSELAQSSWQKAINIEPEGPYASQAKGRLETNSISKEK